jgi:hypothetical protein
MSQIEDDDEADPDLPTYAEAKKEQKELIAELRAGDTGTGV